jgi:hypothetical protein
MDEVQQELSLRSLREFVSIFWKYADPAQYIHNWHVDAICEHLEAVSKGDLRRLIINIPPRCMKSLLTSVFWPAWDWRQHPERKFLFASYAHNLSIRDTVKSRRIIESPLYMKWMRREWPEIKGPKPTPQFRLTSDQNTKIRYENNYHGYRIATSVDGALTGEGGDIIGIDDPHNAIEGESEAKRTACLQWWDEAMSTRLNNANTGAYVIIMQRIHNNDLTGHILEREHKDWCHLCLPMSYEGKTRVTNSPIPFREPRKVNGELLWPKRFNTATVARLRTSLGPYAAAGQLDQRPSPRAGGLCPANKLIILPRFDYEALKRSNGIVDSIRYWDKAGTDGGGCRTAGVLMHRLRNNPQYEYVIEDVVCGQWSYGPREKVIKSTAEMDGPEIKVMVEEEPGSGGKESADRTIKMLAGFRAFKDKVSASKDKRAEPFCAQVDIGNVAVVMAEWTRGYIADLQMYPNGKYKDPMDGTSGAFNNLTLKKKKAGAW